MGGRKFAVEKYGRKKMHYRKYRHRHHRATAESFAD